MLYSPSFTARLHGSTFDHPLCCHCLMVLAGQRNAISHGAARPSCLSRAVNCQHSGQWCSESKTKEWIGHMACLCPGVPSLPSLHAPPTPGAAHNRDKSEAIHCLHLHCHHPFTGQALTYHRLVGNVFVKPFLSLLPSPQAFQAIIALQDTAALTQ